MRPIRPAVLSLGSNAGDRLANLQGAINAFADTPDVNIVAVSSVYETTPVDAPDGSPGVPQRRPARRQHAVGERAARPGDGRRGRLRPRAQTEANGPRTLDVDLIVVGDRISDTDELKLPHPRAHLRAFVLVPWHEIDTHAQLPGRGKIADLLARPRHQRSRPPARSRARDLAVGRPAEPRSEGPSDRPSIRSLLALFLVGGVLGYAFARITDRGQRHRPADPVDARPSSCSRRRPSSWCSPTRRTGRCIASAGGWTPIALSDSCCWRRRVLWSGAIVAGGYLGFALDFVDQLDVHAAAGAGDPLGLRRDRRACCSS